MAVLAFGSLIPSFDAGTTNVPADMTAQIHRGEMIVPAHVASVWRAGQDARGFPADFMAGRWSLPANAQRRAGENDAMNGVGGAQPSANGAAAGGQVVNVNYSVTTNDTAWFGNAVKQHARLIAGTITREMKQNPSLRPAH